MTVYKTTLYCVPMTWQDTGARWEQMTVYTTTLYWVPMTWQDTGTYDGSK